MLDRQKDIQFWMNAAKRVLHEQDTGKIDRLVAAQKVMTIRAYTGLLNGETARGVAIGRFASARRRREIDVTPKKPKQLRS
jgi:hypothetical protein